MKRTSARGGLALCVAAAAVLVTSAIAGAATATPYGSNVVKNPGAEKGAVGTTIPNWETLGTFEVVAYGTPQFPTVAEGNRIHGGHQFFSAGVNNGECDDAIQFITIKGRGADTDSGHVKVTLSARLATYSNQTDTANVVLTFHDSNNHVLNTPHHGDLKLAPVTSSNGKFKLESASKTLPKGTRTLRIILSATHVQGYCDAYFDNVSIKLTHI